MYFVDGTEPQKFFSQTFISHELIYEMNFSFLREAMMLYRHVLQNLQLRSISTNNSLNNSK